MVNDGNMINSQMAPDILSDQAADTRAYGFIAFFLMLSCIVLSTSAQMHASRVGIALAPYLPWVEEASSHVAIFLVCPILPFLMSRFALERGRWSLALAAYLAGFCLFSIGHILLFVAFRTMVWSVFLGRAYAFGLSDPFVWLYEIQKDVYSFLLLASVFWSMRQIFRLRLEARGREHEAQDSGRLTLTSGGRVHLVDSKQVRVAKSAGNYVEIETPQRAFLARMTLGELERLLQAAGDNHIRIHRSCLIHKEEIAEIRPKRDGAASVLLVNGNSVMASRARRPKLNEILNKDTFITSA